jgi:hypothetical protein
MLIREYSPGDLDRLLVMYRKQGFDYKFPDLDDPIFVSKLVVEDESSNVVMAALARLTCEIYLLLDPIAGSPYTRLSRLAALHAAGEMDLRCRGLDDAHAWLPPKVAERFGRRLGDFGWVRDDVWTPYSKILASGTP